MTVKNNHRERPQAKTYPATFGEVAGIPRHVQRHVMTMRIEMGESSRGNGEERGVGIRL